MGPGHWALGGGLRWCLGTLIGVIDSLPSGPDNTPAGYLRSTCILSAGLTTSLCLGQPQLGSDPNLPTFMPPRLALFNYCALLKSKLQSQRTCKAST
jgi:hypothetical protein